MIDLTDDEIRRLLGWANGCDGESYIDEDDWPLIEKLAAAVGDDPSEGRSSLRQRAQVRNARAVRRPIRVSAGARPLARYRRADRDPRCALSRRGIRDAKVMHGTREPA